MNDLTRFLDSGKFENKSEGTTFKIDIWQDPDNPEQAQNGQWIVTVTNKDFIILNKVRLCASIEELLDTVRAYFEQL